ncbi:MAG: ammonium transporter [Planctomycetota bacterium]
MTPEDIQNNLDTAWIVVAAVLVFFMQAGFAMLESGMVRSKNSINVIMKNYTDMCFGAIVFWALGYGLMFGSSSGYFGTDHFMLGEGEGSELAILFFQMMFAATAATIVSGALAERIRFVPYLFAAMTITGVIYPIYGSWVWNADGWLATRGFVDFAGSTVVHSVGGWCALAGVMVLGPRLGKYAQDGQSREIGGHNLPLVAFGGLILWFGWFGFNGGSTLTADQSIGKICLNTHLAGAAGVVGFIMARVIFGGKLLMTQTVNGGLAGLVGITAGCATMDPAYAVATGLAAGFVCVIAMSLCEPLQLDDAVGAIAVHGVCGVWGTLAAGMFYEGDLMNMARVQTQLLGITAAFLWAFPTSWVTFKIISAIVDLRCSSMDEQRGLDFTEHHEVGYPEFQGQLHA